MSLKFQVLNSQVSIQIQDSTSGVGIMPYSETKPGMKLFFLANGYTPLRVTNAAGHATEPQRHGQ